MICPVCGGNVYTDMACDGCNVAYDKMINGIRHDDMRKLMAKGHLSEDDGMELVRELENSSFLVPTAHIDGQFHVMTVSDDKNSMFIPIFTDREEYDKNIDDIVAITNPFGLVLDLLDDRFEGFVVNVENEAFEIDSEFLNRHFPGE